MSLCECHTFNVHVSRRKRDVSCTLELSSHFVFSFQWTVSCHLSHGSHHAYFIRSTHQQYYTYLPTLMHWAWDSHNHPKEKMKMHEKCMRLLPQFYIYYHWYINCPKTKSQALPRSWVGRPELALIMKAKANTAGLALVWQTTSL